MGSDRTIGHSVRQGYFAFFWTMYAVMSFAVPSKDLIDSNIDDLKSAGYLMMLGSVAATVLCWACVIAGFMATKSKLMKYIGLALVGAHFIAVILWAAGSGKQVHYIFDNLSAVFSAREKTGLVGQIITILFMGLSFTILCARDFMSGSEYQNLDQSEGKQSKGHVVGQLWHLFALIVFLILVIGVPYGDHLSSLSTEMETASRLAVAGVCLSILTATAVTVVIFVASPSQNALAKTICFALMATLFVGSILLVAGIGKQLDAAWDILQTNDRTSVVGGIFAAFGFTSFYILYCLPGVGLLN